MMGENSEDCKQNTTDTLHSLGELGFVIRESKSQTVPSQVRPIEHLGSA